MVKYCPLIFCLFVLAGCVLTGPAPQNTSNLYEYTNSTVGYSLKLPKESLAVWNGKEPSDSENTGFGTYQLLGTPNANDYKIKIRMPDSSCSPELHGVFDIPLNNLLSEGQNNGWGKVNFFEKFGHLGETVDYESEWPVCPESISSPESYIYAFCAEKEGKTIVICVNQVTDNPDLAKQIFETFRWTN